MEAAAAAAARRATNMARLSFPKLGSTPLPASHIQRRGLAGGGDHQGTRKVNFWQDPMHPSRWKAEHFVIVSLAGCGLLFYGGYKFFTGDNNAKKDEKVGGSTQ